MNRFECRIITAYENGFHWKCPKLPQRSQSSHFQLLISPFVLMLHDFHLESSSHTTFLGNDRKTKHGCHVNMFESRYVWHIFTDFTQHQAHCYCPAPWILSSFVRFSSTWVSHGAMCLCAVCWHTKDRRQVLSNFSIYCVHVQTFFAFINWRRLNYGIRNHLTSSSTDVKYVETLLLNSFVRRTATNVLHGDRQITAENHRAHPHTHTKSPWRMPTWHQTSTQIW